MTKVIVCYTKIGSNKRYTPTHNVPDRIYHQGKPAINSYLEQEVQKWNPLNVYGYYRDVGPADDIVDDFYTKPSLDIDKYLSEVEKGEHELQVKVEQMSRFYRNTETLRELAVESKQLIDRLYNLHLTYQKYSVK